MSDKERSSWLVQLQRHIESIGNIQRRMQNVPDDIPNKLVVDASSVGTFLMQSRLAVVRHIQAAVREADENDPDFVSNLLDHMEQLIINEAEVLDMLGADLSFTGIEYKVELDKQYDNII